MPKQLEHKTFKSSVMIVTLFLRMLSYHCVIVLLIVFIFLKYKNDKKYIDPYNKISEALELRKIKRLYHLSFCSIPFPLMLELVPLLINIPDRFRMCGDEGHPFRSQRQLVYGRPQLSRSKLSYQGN
jgi:hypothetical protein